MPEESPEHPPRLVGAVAATSVVVGSMVGVGIFLAPRLVAQHTESTAVFVGIWILGGLVSLCGAFVYGELGVRFPRAGGDYVYIERAFGRTVAFAAGWLLFAGIMGGSIASLASGLVSYQLPTLLPALPVDAPLLAGVTVGEALACAIILALTVVNLLGIRLASGVQVVVTAVPIVLLLALSLYAFGTLPHASATPPATEEEGSLTLALLQVYFAYSGWQAVSYVGGEVRDPSRVLPRAFVGGTVLVTALYALVCLAFVVVLGFGGLRDAPEAGTATARALLGEGAGVGMALLITLALTGSLNATVLGGGRLTFAMGEDGVLPRAFGHLSARTRVPARGLWLQAAFACALVLTGTFADLVALTSVAMLLLAALAVVGAARLRRRAPSVELPYRTVGWPVTPIAYVAVSAAVIAGALWNALSAGEWVPVLGLFLFALMLGIGRALNRAG